MATLGLPRDCRLQRGGDFARLKRDGQRIVHGCLILNWARKEGAPHSRVGVVTSRRIGNAVARSRARRLLREAYRLNQPLLTHAVDLVLIARNSIAGKNLASVEKDYLEAMRRARLIPKSPPHPSAS